MNRAERRRQEKAAKKEELVYTMTQKQLNEFEEEVRHKAVVDAFALMLGIPMLVLQDSFGKLMKKETRMEVFSDLVVDKFECFSRGHIDLKDIWDIVEEESGITVERGKGHKFTVVKKARKKPEA